MTREETSRIKKKLVEIINDSVAEGIEASKKSIAEIVKETSARRGVGERQ